MDNYGEQNTRFGDHRDGLIRENRYASKSRVSKRKVKTTLLDHTRRVKKKTAGSGYGCI